MQESLPDLEIYVNSILEVQDWALSKGENWKYAPEWNEVIKQMCIDHGYTYIDNSQITAEHQDLYEGDGKQKIILTDALVRHFAQLLFK